MRIAQLSTPFIAVPPKNYGGIELVVANLTEGLVRRGHDVTLFAPGNSRTSAKLVSAFASELTPQEMEKLFSPLALKLFWMHSLPSFYHAVSAFEKAHDFDIIHNHLHYIGNLLADLTNTPTVHTYHGDLSSAQESPIEAMILEKYKNQHWIAISETQKKNCKIPLNFAAVIHHGIPIEKFTFEEKPQDYLVWLGRITPKKGLTEAIEAARQTDHKLMIAGIVHPRDREYFEVEIKPRIDNKLIFSVGGLDLEAKVKLFKNAKALLYPVSWEEPFGLVMIEAMACGTPVIGFARGAVSEVVRDEETGYLINHKPDSMRANYTIKNTGLKGIFEAIELIYSLPEEKYRLMRQQTRERVEKNFTLDVMVQKHEAVYTQLT